MGARTRFCLREGCRCVTGAGVGAGLGRNRIQASASKGMAAQQPPDGKRAAAQWTVHRDGCGRILGARRHISAPAGTDRMQRRRKPAAIEGDGSEQDARHTSSLRALFPIGQARVPAAPVIASTIGPRSFPAWKCIPRPGTAMHSFGRADCSLRGIPRRNR